MKKFGLIVALMAILCSLPASLSAKTNINFSILFDAAGLMARSHMMPHPPRVYSRHIYVTPVNPYYHERTTIIYQQPVYREVLVPCYPCYPMLP